MVNTGVDKEISLSGKKQHYGFYDFRSKDRYDQLRVPPQFDWTHESVLAKSF